MMKWARHVGFMKVMGSANKILVGKPEGKDNIKMNPKEIGLESMDWIHSV
jgi:hypothetical protein